MIKILSKTQREIINNILEYIRNRKAELHTHYFSVKTENEQNKDNDIYELIDIDSYNSELLKVSVVILTANYFENEILNLNTYKLSGERIKQLQGGLQLLNDNHIVKAYIMKIHNYTVLHLHAPETGSNTPCGSADLVRYVRNCHFIDPSCIISFGICYGTNYKDFSLGDTLIAEKIYPWSIGIKIYDDGWKIKCDDYIINLKEQDAHLYQSIQDIINSTQNLCEGQKATMGNMLTAEAVVSNEKVKIEAIQNAYTCNIIGGEMEGYGLAKECIYYNNTPCIILKAICDWGAIKDIDKYIAKTVPEIKGSYKDQIQAYTTYCAFKVLIELFYKKVFKDNNIILSIRNALFRRFYSDGSIRKNVFNAFIEKYLEDHYRKYSNMSIESKENIKNMVSNSVISQYFKVCNNGECFIFNEFFV